MTDSDASAAQSWVHLARLIRPQGRRGELLAEILTDFPERFAGMHAAYLLRATSSDPTPVILQQSWLHKGKVVLKFAHVDTISDAETLRGAEVVIPAEERVALEPDAVYISDLIGCELVDVHTANAVRLGSIREVIQQEKTADLLVVVAENGNQHWIPFAKAYLVKIDIAGRRLEMNLPPGLLEVNAPLNDEERQARQDESEP